MNENGVYTDRFYMFIDVGEYFLINLNLKSSFRNNLFILLYLINEKYILKIIYKNLA
jgi:hypothetical protein